MAQHKQKKVPSHATYPSLLNISIEGMPRLNVDNWIEWQAVLLDVLAPYKGATDILTGRIAHDSPEYSAKTDTELMSLVHRLVSSEMRVHVRQATRKVPHRGSTVYQELKMVCLVSPPTRERRVEQEALRKEIKGIQQKRGESYTSYVDRFKDIVLRSEEYGLHLVDEDMIFNEGEALLDCFRNGLTEEYQRRASALANSIWSEVATDWEWVADMLRK